MSGAATLFICAGVAYTRIDVLEAAAAWGAVQGVRIETQRRLACLAAARAAGRDFDEASLQTASESFRRARGLRNGSLTRTWLARWDVSLEALGDFLERDAAARAYGASLPESAPRAVLHDGAFENVLWEDAVFTGMAEHWCLALAERAAVAAAAGLPLPEGPHRWTALEDAHAALARHAAGPETLEAALEARWRDLYRFECEFGSFASAAAAMEARCCIEQDAEPMAAVCGVADAPYRREALFHLDMPDALRTPALSSAPGTLLPPIEACGAHVLCRVIAKCPPDLADPDTRGRVRALVVSEALRPIVAAHVVWPEAAS